MASESMTSKEIINFLQRDFTDEDQARFDRFTAREIRGAIAYSIGQGNVPKVTERATLFLKLKESEEAAKELRKITIASGLWGITGTLAGVVLGWWLGS